MYIDPLIKTDGMPARLMPYFDELQEYYEADNYYAFMDLLEIVEAMVKNLYSAGKISVTQLNAIFRKYGMG